MTNQHCDNCVADLTVKAKRLIDVIDEKKCPFQIPFWEYCQKKRLQKALDVPDLLEFSLKDYEKTKEVMEDHSISQTSKDYILMTELADRLSGDQSRSMEMRELHKQLRNARNKNEHEKEKIMLTMARRISMGDHERPVMDYIETLIDRISPQKVAYSGMCFVAHEGPRFHPNKKCPFFA